MIIIKDDRIGPLYLNYKDIYNNDFIEANFDDKKNLTITVKILCAARNGKTHSCPSIVSKHTDTDNSHLMLTGVANKGCEDYSKTVSDCLPPTKYSNSECVQPDFEDANLFWYKFVIYGLVGVIGLFLIIKIVKKILHMNKK